VLRSGLWSQPRIDRNTWSGCQTAIHEIRKARPGSIETTAQVHYIANCAPVALGRVNRSPLERALACILGGAVGDEGLLQSLGQGEDWQKTFISSIRIAYLNWFSTQKSSAKPGKTSGNGWLAAQTVMQAQRAPGNTCLAALGAGGHGTLKKLINDSKGCGGVMRVAPIGLVGARARTQDVFQLAAEAAALTHGHPSGFLSAGMMASLVHFLAQGANLTHAVNESCAILSGFSGHEETLSIVKNALNLASQRAGNHDVAIEQLGGGWVGEGALAIGLYAVLSANSFVEAIAIAANHSGDSDSTGYLKRTVGGHDGPVSRGGISWGTQCNG
jgi:ADP-ribosylglycohydrolase